MRDDGSCGADANDQTLMLCEDQGEDDGAGDSGCDCDGDWPQGATASSSMIPRIRLYTASGKCLKKKVLKVSTRSPQAHRQDKTTDRCFNRSSRAIARSRSPLPSSARNMASHVDG